MDTPVNMTSSPSLTPRSTPYTRSPPPQTHNPYQRMASRRPIACVTCAKAKTKCDKGLPSCSRCTTKGIKCEPRSTRRTSDNSYRTNIKKPFVSPKRYNSTSNIPSLVRHSSPRSMPSLNRDRPMRAASHIDFRTAVKMSQQASNLSGFPMLTPLPTYNSQIIDECYSYSSSPDQNLTGFTPNMGPSHFNPSGRLTPQTPEPITYHEPVSMGSMPDQWMNVQPWSDDTLVSVGLGFDGDMTTMLPTELWSAPETAHSAPIAQMAWPHSSLSVSPQSIASELVPHASSVPPLSISECSVEDFNTPGAYHENWAHCQPGTTHQLETGSMVTSAPFMHELRAISGSAPVWEDVFMPGAAPY